MVVVVKVVDEMVAAAVVVVVVTMDATVRSVTNVTKLGISHANARKTLIVVIVAMGLVTLPETAASRPTNRLAIHATEPAIWPVTVRMLRAVAVIVNAVVIAAAIVNAVVIAVAIAVNATCLVTLVTRVVTFHATVRMAPSHAIRAATRDISVVNVPRMVAEIKKQKKTFIMPALNHFFFFIKNKKKLKNKK